MLKFSVRMAAEANEQFHYNLMLANALLKLMPASGKTQFCSNSV